MSNIKRVCVFASSCNFLDSSYYEAAAEFGDLLGKFGFDMVYGRSSLGLMWACFEKVKQNIIKEIFIGPKSEVEVEDVINLLSYYGYYDGIEEEYNSHTPVDIQKSYTTYR